MYEHALYPTSFYEYVHFSVCMQDMTKVGKLNLKAQGKAYALLWYIREVRTKATGHEFFKGLWYCPSAPGQIDFEEWVTQRHIEYDLILGYVEHTRGEPSLRASVYIISHHTLYKYVGAQMYTDT